METTTRGGLTTTMQYDAAGHNISINDPDLGHLTYSYDAIGNLKTQTDSRGCIVVMDYDALNRPTLKSGSGTGCGSQTRANFTYDSASVSYGIGRRTGMTDISGAAIWQYDARGRVTGETRRLDGRLFTTFQTYNSADLPVSMTYPDGEVVTNTYTPQMLVNNVTGSSVYVNSTSYDSAGRMKMRFYGNNTQTLYDYFARNVQGGRLFSIRSGTASLPTALQKLEYSYDSVGNVSTISDQTAGSQLQFFAYDNLDRLTSASASALGTDPGYYETYSYDPDSGNLLTKAGQTFNYDPAHPHAVKTVAGTANSFEYDANGSMVTRNVAGTSVHFGYNAEGQLAASDDSPLPELGAAPAPAAVFADVPNGNFYKPYIEALYTANITSGCAANPLRYCPGKVVSRAEIAVMLLKAEHGAGYQPPAVGSSTGFTDVPTNHWAAAWIKQFKLEGITSGCGTGLYCPDTAVTREQAAVFILHAKGVWTVPVYTSYSYTDISASGTKDFIQYLASDAGGGISDYCSGSMFCPAASLTRDILASLVARVFSLPVNESGVAMYAPATTNAIFVYDGDGKRVKSIINGVTTLFVGSHYELSAGTSTKYYFAGASRIASRTCTGITCTAPVYYLSDQLGSTSLTVDAGGAKIAELRYKAFGEVRYSTGTTPTKYQYTGQYSNVADFGLMYYNARWYDSYLGRFAQADTIVPPGVQGLDRYAAMANNPVRYTDPSGHMQIDDSKITRTGVCKSGDTSCNKLGNYPGKDPGYTRDSHDRKDRKGCSSCHNIPGMDPTPTIPATPTASCSGGPTTGCATATAFAATAQSPCFNGTCATPTPTPTQSRPTSQSDTWDVAKGEVFPNGSTTIGLPSLVIPPGDAALLTNSFKDLEISTRMLGGWTATTPIVGLLYGETAIKIITQTVTNLWSDGTFIFIPTSTINNLIPPMD
jgi:RHS repeat-associated protein